MSTTTEANRERKKNPFVSGALDQFRFFGSLTPHAFEGKSTHANLENSVVIFADVLRATTTQNAAVAAGCRGINLAVKPRNQPYDATPPVFPDEYWLFGGEENGRAIPGGVIDNSPASVMTAEIDGAFLKFFSTNGARALQLIMENHTGAVFLLSMANIEATMEAVASCRFDRFYFVSSGFYDSASLEDCVCCGRAIRYLIDILGLPGRLDDEAIIMLNNAEKFPNDEELIKKLESCQVAHLLGKMGKIGDVATAVSGKSIENLWSIMRQTVIQLSTVSCVPILRRWEPPIIIP